MAVHTCENHYSSTKDPSICAALSLAYRGGYGIPKDMYRSVEWMRKAFDSDPDRYMRDYCNLLLESDDVELHKEAMDRCLETYEASESAFAAKAISDMYRDGKGVDSDSRKALEWMRRAVAKNHGYMVDYRDLILSIDDDEIYKESMDGCLELYEDTGASAYAKLLSMMCWDGKGVHQDLDKALEWMRKAADSDPDGYTADLCELLLETGD